MNHEKEDNEFTDKHLAAIDKNSGASNLIPFDSNSARTAQLASAKKRVENMKKSKEEKEMFKTIISLVQEEADSFDVSGVDVMKFLMAKAIADGDDDKVGYFAEKIAEYQDAKISRVDQTTTTVAVDESTESLEARLADLKNKRNS